MSFARNNELFAGGFDVRDMTFRHGGPLRKLGESSVAQEGTLPDSRANSPTSKALAATACGSLRFSKTASTNTISASEASKRSRRPRYAQLDFTTIDQRLGTLEELRELTQKAHELQMYVIIDASRRGGKDVCF